MLSWGFSGITIALDDFPVEHGNLAKADKQSVLQTQQQTPHSAALLWLFIFLFIVVILSWFCSCQHKFPLCLTLQPVVTPLQSQLSFPPALSVHVSVFSLLYLGSPLSTGYFIRPTPVLGPTSNKGPGAMRISSPEECGECKHVRVEKDNKTSKHACNCH